MSQPAKKNFTKKSPYAGAKHFTNQEILDIFTAYYNGPLKEYTKRYSELRAKIAEINADDDLEPDEKKKKKAKVNAELKALERPKSPLSLDIKNENGSEQMKENGVRYITPLLTGLDGKERPLVRDTYGTPTSSKCGFGKTEPGKMPSACTWQTRILFPYWPDQECPVKAARHTLELESNEENDKIWDDIVAQSEIKIRNGKFTVTEKFVDTLLRELADATVSKKFPHITKDEFEDASKRQEELLRGQYLQWHVEDIIDREFTALVDNYATQEEIGWHPSDKQTIEGNVQRGRKPNPTDKAEQALAKQLKEETGRGLIPLDEPIVYYRNRIGRDGELWGNVYDSLKNVKGKPKCLATCKNPDTGKVEIVNYKTFCDFLRYGSVYTGFVKYQVCISALAGARLHGTMPEMHVRRAAKSAGRAQTSDDQIDNLNDFGGQFAGDDDEDDDAPAPSTELVVKRPPQQLTALEKQMQLIDAAAADDE